MKYLYGIILVVLLTACTDYVQRMDDGFDEWERAQNQTEYLSFDEEEYSSSFSDVVSSGDDDRLGSCAGNTSSSSSSVILSGDSHEESSSSIKSDSSSVQVSSSSFIIVSSSGEVVKSSSGKNSWAYLNPAISYGEMTDSRDGQVYKTVKIGEQTWMAENLNFEETNSFCYNDSASNCAKYGRLYTWGAAMDSTAKFSSNGKGCGYGKTCSSRFPVQGVCPEGWILPDTSAWYTLFSFVGGISVAGKILKTRSGWNGGDNGIDSYGFSAFPGGLGNLANGFSNIGNYADFWSSTESNIHGAYRVYIKYDSDGAILSGQYDKSYGRSVRCLKKENINSSSSEMKSSSSTLITDECKMDPMSEVWYCTQEGRTTEQCVYSANKWVCQPQLKIDAKKKLREDHEDIGDTVGLYLSLEPSTRVPFRYCYEFLDKGAENGAGGKYAHREDIVYADLPLCDKGDTVRAQFEKGKTTLTTPIVLHAKYDALPEEDERFYIRVCDLEAAVYADGDRTEKCARLPIDIINVARSSSSSEMSSSSFAASDYPEFDPTIFARDYVYWEGDTLEVLSIKLSKEPETEVTFDYCYSFINPCNLGTGLCAESADLNINNPDPKNPQRKLPICGSDTGHVKIPIGSLVPTDSAFMPIINVKKDGKEENDEYLKLNILNLAGAVVKYKEETFSDTNITVNIQLGDRN